MSIVKGQITSGDSVIFPRTSIDNIVGSTANPNIFVTSGGKILADYLDLQDDIASAVEVELNKAPTTLAVQTYVSGVADTKQDNLTASNGVLISASIVYADTPTVSNVIEGTSDTKLIDVKALRGALTAGQAVDVTSKPDGVSESVYKGSFSYPDATLGFASFPKFSSGKSYLMIADVSITGSSKTVTPSGTWLDGTTTAKTLDADSVTRIAMLFNSINKAKFTFGGSGQVTISNLREYEVTACTSESISYISFLSNPDAFEKYYLVKSDMIQPWTSIINMGAAEQTTIAAGLAYQIYATTGSHVITVDACPEGYIGQDSYVRLYVGSTGNIVVKSPLILATGLTANAINNCKVQYRDGVATLTVTDILGGYIVTVNSGESDGSLYYGLVTGGTDYKYINFGAQTDGTSIDIGGATTAGEEKFIVGNGFDKTTLTGSINCKSKTVVNNVSLDNVVVSSGTLTLGDVYIPSGSTVAMSGGGLAIERVSGSGIVTRARVVLSAAASAAGVTFSSCGGPRGSNIPGGAFFVSSGGSLYASGVTFDNCEATQGGAVYMGAANALTVLTDCTISNCSATAGRAIAFYAGSASLTRCTFLDNMSGASITLRKTTVGVSECDFSDTGVNLAITSSSVVNIAGSNYFSGSITGDATAVLNVSSGAIIDLTGNTNATPIAPGGGIIVDGGCTVINSAGTTVSIAAGSYTIIKKDGTTE